MLSWRKPWSPAGVLVLGLAAALAGAHLPTAAAQAAADLRVSAGKVHGELRAEPLRQALEALGAGRDFALELPDALAAYPVSARLDDLPLAEALAELLRPFDHVLTFDAAGGLTALRIRGTRQAWSPPARQEAAQEEAGEGAGGPVPLDVVGPDGMSPRERRALEEAAQGGYAPPEERPNYVVWDEQGQVIDEGVDIVPDPDDVVGADGLSPRERWALEEGQDQIGFQD